MSSKTHFPQWMLSEEMIQALYPSPPSAEEKGLDAIFAKVILYYSETQDWYLSRKDAFRRRARLSRLVAIIGVALATLWPVLELVGLTSLLVPLFKLIPSPIDPLRAVGLLGYAFATIGSVALLYDTYSGNSQSWMRFVTAAQNLQKHGASAQAGYAKLIATNATSEIKAAFIVQSVTTLWDIIGAETASWTHDYQQDLQQLSHQLSQSTQKAQTPAS